MTKRILLFAVILVLVVTSLVYAADNQSILSKLTGISDKEISTLLQSRVGYGRILNASIVAKLTGNSIQDVLKTWQEGKSFVQIAQEKGIQLEQYKKAMLDGRNAYIDEQVKAGILTADQANIIKDRISQKIEQCDGTGINQTGRMGNGFGRMRGNGGGFNNWRSQPNCLFNQ